MGSVITAFGPLVGKQALQADQAASTGSAPAALSAAATPRFLVQRSASVQYIRPPLSLRDGMAKSRMAKPGRLKPGPSLERTSGSGSPCGVLVLALVGRLAALGHRCELIHDPLSGV